MAKSKDGIEKGDYSTSGVNDTASEPKQRGGDGSAKVGRMMRDHDEDMAAMGKMRRDRPTPHMFAHKMPVTG